MQAVGTAFVYLVRFLRLIVGLGLVVVFLWALGDQKYTEASYSEAVGVFRDIDKRDIATIAADHVDPSREGDFVHIQGELAIERPIDPLTGLSLEAVTLIRHVEMLQWKEERYRPINRPTDDWQYRHALIWSEELIDSDSFMHTNLLDEQQHENPQRLPHETGLLIPGGIRLGAWPLDLSLADRLVEPQPVPAELLQSAPVADGWYTNGAYLYPVRNADSIASDVAGNVRIRYEYLPLAEGRYSAAGLVSGGRLTDGVVDRVYSLPLMAPGDVSADELLDRTISVLSEGRSPQKHWIGYVFVGLLLCIGVIARFFPFLKGFTEAPFPKRATITVAAAAIGTALAGVFA
jgi:hypothetical protein